MSSSAATVTAVDAAPNAEPLTLARTARRNGALRTALGTWEARIGLAMALLVVGVAIVGPWVAPHDPNEFVGPPFGNTAGVLGTDTLGRDVFSRLLFGGRSILMIATAATVLGVLVGTAIGLVAGTTKRWWSEWLMRGVDLVLAFPLSVLALLFVTRIGPEVWLLVLVIATAHAPRVARVVRAASAEVAERNFITSARALGMRRRTLVAGEVLPNVTGPIMVELGLSLTFSASIIAGLSFLGFGTQAPDVDWGLMIKENQPGLTLWPAGVLAPVVTLAMLTIGINLVTDAIAKAVARVESAP